MILWVNFCALVRRSPTDEHEKIRQRTPVVIEFCARWCGPSQRINPAFDKCSERLHYDGLGFYRVDIDSQPDIMQVADVKKVGTDVFSSATWVITILFRFLCSRCLKGERNLELLKGLTIVLWL